MGNPRKSCKMAHAPEARLLAVLCAIAASLAPACRSKPHENAHTVGPAAQGSAGAAVAAETPAVAATAPARPEPKDEDDDGSANSPNTDERDAGLASASPKFGRALAGSCPPGFTIGKGTNTGFPTRDSGMRQFVVSLPEDLSTPRPVLVVLTGTLQPTLNFLTSNAFEHDLLPAGWILLSPVHACATSAEQVSTQDCQGAGSNGWQAASWNDAASTGAAGMQWWSDPGPDARFLEAMVQCAASEWPVDADRLFLAGVSGGATLINRVLTFRPEFWAGGLPVEGQWHTRPDDNDVNEMPDRIYEGRCCPIPLPSALAPMVVVTVFGGWQDGIFFYAPGAGAQAASNYFASMKDVVHLACMGQWGHRWPPLRESGREFNLWMASMFMAHPKGSDPNSFQWPTPPEGVECQLGRFTRLFPPDPVDP